jgi:integrase
MAKKPYAYSMNHTKYLLPGEVEHLQGLLTREAFRPTTTVVRDKLMLRLALSTGIRASELVSLEKTNLVHHTNSIFINALKNGIDREMPLRAKMFAELAAYCETTQGHKIFDIGYDCLIKRVWSVYRPARKKFHSLRHTFAIRLYMRTRDIHLVKTALGHSSMDTTMVYLNYIYQIEELRRITSVAI